MRASVKISAACLVILSLGCVPVFAKEAAPKVRAFTDKTQILIGERLIYNIEVAADEDTEVAFPEFKDGNIGDFEIRQSSAYSKKSIFEHAISARRYDITIYSTGKALIPKAEIKYRKKSSSSWSTAAAGPVSVVVTSVLPTDKAARDILEIKGPLYFFEVNWLFAALGSLTIAVAFLASLIYGRIRGRAPLKLPHETALEELEAIRGDFLKGGGIKDYYVGVSDCIRCYIERAFRVKAPEMTTEEFLNSLRESSALLPDQKDLLRDFLSSCDLVKFAKHSPKEKEAESVYLSAKKFVEETRPQAGPNSREG